LGAFIFWSFAKGLDVSTKQQAKLRKKRQYLRKPGVVVDKSYLYMFSPRDAEELNGRYLVLMSETLLYEVSKDEEHRSRLLKNVREYSADFAYVEHYHNYIEYEKRHINKSPPPSHFFKDRDYSRFDLMVKNEFVDVSELIENRKKLIEMTAESVIALARILREKYAEAFTGRNEVAALEREKLEKKVADDPGFVRTFLAQNAVTALGEDHEIAAKIASKATEEWAHYRVTQTVLLLAIDVAHRQNLNEPIAEATRSNVTHDVLDSQLLMLATLVGRIATRDEKIQRWWELLMRKPVDFGRKVLRMNESESIHSAGEWHARP
jgi:hypothetical protein